MSYNLVARAEHRPEQGSMHIEETEAKCDRASDNGGLPDANS
jgi:hypothetical protein